MNESPQAPTPSSETQDFLASTHRLLIGSEWVESDSGKRINIFDPSTEQKIAEVCAGGAVDIDKAVRAARKAFEEGPWTTMGATARADLMLKLADLLDDNEKLFAKIEVVNNGMPINPGGAMAASRAARMLRYFAGWTTKITGQTFPSEPPAPDVERMIMTRREPVGVAGQIIPWNYPLGMTAMKLGPALATGCTIVLKPDEKTPLSALLLGRLVEQAGFPAGVINIVPGIGEEAGAALAAHPDVDKIAFTGSTEVGKKIVEASAGNLKKVTLELGGKSPFIVFPDADLEKVIPMAVRMGFFLQSQNCACPSRIYVHEDVIGKVIDGMVTHTRALKIGPGLDPSTNIGPLITAGQLARAQEFVESGKADGAELVTGGGVLDGPGHFMEPAIFANTRSNMRIIREEIFGPVLSVQSFDGDGIDEIIAEANNTPYGLAASVWTRDISRALRVAYRIKAGEVGINVHGIPDSIAPFGGYKQSGWGRENGAEGLEPYLQTKTIWTHF